MHLSDVVIWSKSFVFTVLRLILRGACGILSVNSKQVIAVTGKWLEWYLEGSAPQFPWHIILNTYLHKILNSLHWKIIMFVFLWYFPRYFSINSQQLNKIGLSAIILMPAIYRTNYCKRGIFKYFSILFTLSKLTICGQSGNLIFSVI